MSQIENNSDNNPPDIREIHKNRFKWKKMVISTPKHIKSIRLKLDDNNTINYYFEVIDDVSSQSNLKEIIHAKILSKLQKIENSYKVIGARGRNIIIGEIDLKDINISDSSVLILCSLSDWRGLKNPKTKY